MLYCVRPLPAMSNTPCPNHASANEIWSKCQGHKSDDLSDVFQPCAESHSCSSEAVGRTRRKAGWKAFYPCIKAQGFELKPQISEISKHFRGPLNLIWLRWSRELPQNALIHFWEAKPLYVGPTTDNNQYLHLLQSIDTYREYCVEIFPKNSVSLLWETFQQTPNSY